VEQFEGDITVDSELKVGSTFTFKIKLSPKDFDGISEKPEETNLENFRANTQKMAYKWQPAEKRGAI
jgi:hypothetical protein